LSPGLPLVIELAKKNGPGAMPISPPSSGFWNVKPLRARMNA